MAHPKQRSAALLCVAALGLCLAGPAQARQPNGSADTPPDRYIPPRTPAQAAFERVKLGLVASIRGAGQPVAVARGATPSVDSFCVSDCGGGGGSGDSGPGIGGDGGDATGTVPVDSTGGSGTSDGSTGMSSTSQLLQRTVLDARPRHQSTVYWCGPASGQVVINFSRGLVFSSLNGDSTATNWRPQSTLAAWMKTSESSGTLGANLAAALNRPDAVLKPMSEWSYLYTTNADGADMHAKIMADIGRYAMPLLIAVKPHKTGAAYWLPSWPREAGNAKHWITIYGYDGRWDGTDQPVVYYTESAGNGAKGPGSYIVGALTMWKVNLYNASTMVW